MVSQPLSSALYIVIELFCIFLPRQYDNRVLHQMATTCMETADVNKDGEIDFDEFKTAVMKNQVCTNMLCSGKMTDCSFSLQLLIDSPFFVKN